MIWTPIQDQYPTDGTFLALEASFGEPDGFAMDVEGCLWVAVWRGSRVIRVDEHGEIMGEILPPTRYVICAEFVGSKLVITTVLQLWSKSHMTTLSQRDGVGKFTK